MRVLVVDDSRAMRLIVIRQLRQAGLDDAEFIEAQHGIEALQHLGEGTVDLVLSDWNMPEMNGLELLRELRSRDDQVLFGFVTSEGTPDMVRLARESGASFLISKPFTPNNFRDTFEAIGVRL
ncbi:MAG: response regulator [Ferrimicrobium sp.]|uniref:Response regulator n=1 Tax=Ferrimicrobium acidiphilum TaxID=121039 RepID=A0ABV3Y2U4_9ACTN|nr:response regulator [Ferrimicrobium sp.]MCL5973778.1 response regulator [Actinomycetota bacterium]